MRRVKESGGRFLKKGEDGLWYEIGDDEAKVKARGGKSRQYTAPHVRLYGDNC